MRYGKGVEYPGQNKRSGHEIVMPRDGKKAEEIER
jgi:hypothetical protein